MEKIIFEIVLAIILFVVFVEIMNLITRISKYFENMSKKVEAETLKILQKREHNPTYEMTDDLITIINFMIDNEIQFRINLLSYSRTPYKLLNLDKDIKDISKSVFDQINKDELEKSDLLITTDYIMHYIMNQVTIRLAGAMHEYNINVAASSPNENE